MAETPSTNIGNVDIFNELSKIEKHLRAVVALLTTIAAAQKPATPPKT